ncbi:MAG: hypothetical protein VZS44_09360 [Bacilli bacterium]|nr:hypothetical protein [Bacilli bacterium]
MKEVYINIKDFGELFIGKYLYENIGKDIISIEELIGILEDEIAEKEVWQEKYEDLEKDLEDNYISRPMSDYTGDSYDDRF